MTEKEQQEDRELKAANSEYHRNDAEELKKPEEKMINIIDLFEKYKSQAINEVRGDFREFAYRLFSVELVLFKILKEKKREELTQELRHNAEVQEDILIANVETILKRMKELTEKIDAEAKEKQQEEAKK